MRMAPEAVAKVEAAAAGLRAYALERIAVSRAHPGDDLVTRLVEAEVDGHRLSEDEVVAMVTGFVFAGAETTRRQLTAAVQLLAEHPDVWERLAADPELVPGAVEEILRHRGIIAGLTRRAEAPFDHDDLEVPEGGRLLLAFDTANRYSSALRGRRPLRPRPPRRPRPPHLRVGPAPLRGRRPGPPRARRGAAGPDQPLRPAHRDRRRAEHRHRCPGLAAGPPPAAGADGPPPRPSWSGARRRGPSAGTAALLGVEERHRPGAQRRRLLAEPVGAGVVAHELAGVGQPAEPVGRRDQVRDELRFDGHPLEARGTADTGRASRREAWSRASRVGAAGGGRCNRRVVMTATRTHEAGDRTVGLHVERWGEGAAGGAGARLAGRRRRGVGRTAPARRRGLPPRRPGPARQRVQPGGPTPRTTWSTPPTSPPCWATAPTWSPTPTAGSAPPSPPPADPEAARSLTLLEPAAFGVGHDHPAVAALVDQVRALWDDDTTTPSSSWPSCEPSAATPTPSRRSSSRPPSRWCRCSATDAVSGRHSCPSRARRRRPTRRPSSRAATTPASRPCATPSPTGIGAERLVVAGAGHEIQFTGEAINEVLRRVWRS